MLDVDCCEFNLKADREIILRMERILALLLFAAYLCFHISIISKLIFFFAESIEVFF